MDYQYYMRIRECNSHQCRAVDTRILGQKCEHITIRHQLADEERGVSYGASSVELKDARMAQALPHIELSLQDLCVEEQLILSKRHERLV